MARGSGADAGRGVPWCTATRGQPHLVWVLYYLHYQASSMTLTSDKSTILGCTTLEIFGECSLS